MESPPCVKLGQALNWCASSLKEQQVEGRILLPAEYWAGWRIVRQILQGPGGMRFDARSLTAAWRHQRFGRSAIVPGGTSIADTGVVPRSTA